jgi:hypothetical protein
MTTKHKITTISATILYMLISFLCFFILYYDL